MIHEIVLYLIRFTTKNALSSVGIESSQLRHCKNSSFAIKSNSKDFDLKSDLHRYILNQF